jgi:hypothetical protein
MRNISPNRIDLGAEFIYIVTTAAEYQLLAS